MSEQDQNRRVPRTWEAARRMARASAAAVADEEDAAITAAAHADPDNLPLTAEFWARARPLGNEQLRRRRGQRGPQKSKPVKNQVTLRLDPDIIAHFKKRGTGWQSRLNATLRKALNLPRQVSRS